MPKMLLKAINFYCRNRVHMRWKTICLQIDRNHTVKEKWITEIINRVQLIILLDTFLSFLEMEGNGFLGI
jgi:hypothetical protein